MSRATLHQAAERFTVRWRMPGGPGALSTERFRINLIVEGDDIAPWAEFDWLGREVQMGEVRLKIVVGLLGEEFGDKYLGVLGVMCRAAQWW